MFDAYGIEPSTSRLDTYLSTLGLVPAESLAEAIETAMRESKDYPPGPGHIVQCWKAKNTRTVYAPHGYSEVMGGLEREAVKALPDPDEIELGDGASWRQRLFAKALELRHGDRDRVEREGRAWSYTAAAAAQGGDPKTWLPRRRGGLKPLGDQP